MYRLLPQATPTIAHRVITQMALLLRHQMAELCHL